LSRPLNVLVADDHDVHRMLLTTMFECFGCTVTSVADGAQALAAKGPFDLVCLDRHMPVLGGVAVARAMQGQAYLVACTSDPSGGLSDFQMVLTKPISCDAISRAVGAAQIWRRRSQWTRSILCGHAPRQAA
jgi:CheY-like chemotaxis protein